MLVTYGIDQILIFGGYVKVREYLCTRVLFEIDTNLSFIDSKTISSHVQRFLHGVCVGYIYIYISKWH